VWHFRRQVPFGTRHIADSAAHRARLIVEIDGNTHDPEAPAEVARSAWLEAQGYRVVRFTNAEVTEWRLVERALMAVLGIG
jgi:very-short-patch-repair endonuclease